MRTCPLALLVAAGMIAAQSIREILTPHHLPHWSTLLVLVLVVATKMILARWMGEIGEESESTSVQADDWHHWADALTSIAAFGGITIGLISGPGYEPADVLAVLIACGVIVFSGVNLLRMAVRELLDAAPAKEFEQKVRDLASGVDGVRALDKPAAWRSGDFEMTAVDSDGYCLRMSTNPSLRGSGGVPAFTASTAIRSLSTR